MTAVEHPVVEAEPDGGWVVRLTSAPSIPGNTPDLIAAVDRLTAAVEGGSTLPLAVGIPQASELLSVGRSFMWELVRSGEVPTVRLGKRRLIRTADLVRWIAEVPTS